MIQNARIAELITIQKLASYFRVKKDTLMDDVGYHKGADDTLQAIYSPLLNENFGFNRRIYACKETGTFTLASMIDYDKFLKTKVCEQFEMGEQAVADHRYSMTLYLKGSLWIINRNTGHYGGVGGIHIAGESGFDIEPIKNYLSYNYPHPEF